MNGENFPIEPGSTPTPITTPVSVANGGTGSATGDASNLTNLPAGQLTGNVPLAALTTALAAGGDPIKGTVLTATTRTETPTVGTDSSNQHGLPSGTGQLVAGDDARMLPAPTAAGKIPYDTGSGYAETAAGTAHQLLHGGTTPSYGAVDLTAEVSGVMPVAHGGTGSATGDASSLVNLQASQVVGALSLANMAALVVNKYTSAGTYTWTKNSNSRFILIALCGAGAGGGSGRQGTAAVSGGGGGGGGGSTGLFCFLASDIPSPQTVTVGGGGAGGAAQVSASTNGNAGAAGGLTSFGSLFQCGGGIAGATGGSTTTTAASGGGIGVWQGQNGGTGVINAVGNFGTSFASFGSGSGGGGGGPQAANFSAGGGSAICWPVTATRTAGGATAGAGGTDGTSLTYIPFCGPGGGGGASGDSAGTIVGGKGGAGGFPGGGGGGGGGSVNGANSGAGGNGADGCAWIIEF